MNGPKLGLLKDNLMPALESNPPVRYNYVSFHSVLFLSLFTWL